MAEQIHMANTSTQQAQQDEEPTLAKSDSILDNPDLAEATLLALLCNKTEPLLAYGGQTHKDLVTYSRKWLKLVSDEFRAECNDGLHKKPRGLECTITHLGQLKDAPREAHWVAVKIKESVKYTVERKINFVDYFSFEFPQWVIKAMKSMVWRRL